MARTQISAAKQTGNIEINNNLQEINMEADEEY